MSRRGLWTIAIATSFGVVFDLGLRALAWAVGAASTWSRLEQFVFHAGQATSTALRVAVVVAAWMCARCSEPVVRGAYRLFAIGTAIASVCWLAVWIELTKSDWPARDIVRLFAAGAAITASVGMLGFARAAARSDARRELVRALRVLVWVGLASAVISYAKSGRAGVWLSTVEYASTLAGALAVAFVAFDLLGGLPRGDAPTAHIDARARSVAGAAAIAACIVGIFVAAISLWVTQRTSTEAGATSGAAIGIVVFTSGAFALRWLRKGRASFGYWAGATAVLIVGGRFVLVSNALPVDRIDLEKHALPGLEISLPNGRTYERDISHDSGTVDVFSRRDDIGMITVEWHRRDTEPDRTAYDYRDVYRRSNGSVEVVGRLDSRTKYGMFDASWQCPGDTRWFTLRLSGLDAGAATLRTLADRIVDTIRCLSSP